MAVQLPAAQPTLDMSTQYWTSRGFAVVDVNYGGSTGYGRDYREQLHEQWGIVDVEDCQAAARWLVEHDRVDPNRLCITGGSAGGFTTLAALAFGDTFSVGPVTLASPTSRPWRLKPTSSRAATSMG